MFTNVSAAVSFFRSAISSAVSARGNHDLNLLDQVQRTSVQERKARGIETRLFFDAELLASAQARQLLAQGLKKSLLACGAGLLLLANPMSGQANEIVTSDPVPLEATASNDEEAALADKLAGWLEELVGMQDDGEGDPDDGDH